MQLAWGGESSKRSKWNKRVTDESGVEASFALFSDSFYSRLQMGLVHACCGRGSRTRRCHWLADFRGSGRGRDWCTDWLVRGDVVFWLVGGATVDQAAIERVRLTCFYPFFLAFVSRFAYKPLYSSQNHPLNCRQDRQSVTFTSEAGGRAGSPWDMAHTGAKGILKER